MLQYMSFFILCIGISVGLTGCGGNSSSPTTPAHREKIIYAALGASDAVGVGAFPLDNGYVYKIRDGLEPYANEVELHNLGVSGERIGYIERTELPAALARTPDVVTIWAGPNDLTGGVSVETFEASLANVFAQLKNAASACVVMANVPDLTALPLFQLFPDEDVTIDRVQAYNAAIARQTAAYNILLVDLYTPKYAENWSYVSLDGYHPSNEGHAKIAELYLELLLKNL